MHQKNILEYLVFDSVEIARNYLVMKYAKRKLVEPEENKFICKRFGTTFRIIELKEY